MLRSPISRWCVLYFVRWTRVKLLYRTTMNCEQGFGKLGILLHYTLLNPHQVIYGGEPRGPVKFLHEASFRHGGTATGHWALAA